MLNDIIQLTDISGPGRIDESLHSLRREPLGGFITAAGQGRDKIFSQHRDILFSLMQRGQHQADDIETIEKVFAELFDFNGLFKITVGGRNNPHINRHRG